MKYQKSLFVSGFAMAFGLLLGLGTNALAKEWEQSLVVNLTRHDVHGPIYGYTRWGFSKDSLVVDSSGVVGKGITYWQVDESCVCGFLFGGCGYYLYHWNFFDYDQSFWNVALVEGLKAGIALDLNDTTAFAEITYYGSDLLESYKFSEKRGSSANDTNYFVYRKDSTYYALCQYITVYNSSIDNKGEMEEGVPAYFAHQCIFQDDGTPTFSKIPMYTGELPEGKPVDPPSVVAKPMRKKVEPNVDRKPYLVNGQSAKKNSASGARVEKERVFRQ